MLDSYITTCDAIKYLKKRNTNGSGYGADEVSGNFLSMFWMKNSTLHPVYFILMNLIFGEGFRFLNFSISKAWPSLIYCNPFLKIRVLFKLLK